MSNISGGVWSLVGKTAGIADSDLIPSSDKKSAVFTGHLVGTAAINVISGSLSSVNTGTLTVNIGAVSKLGVSGYSIPVNAGTAGNFTVTAQDTGGNTITTYIGTVHFTSTDSHAILPADYTFVAGDHGTHTFSATFDTAGNQSVTATDTVTATITGTQGGITINPSNATQISVETAPTGSGTIVSAQNLTSGNSITAYVVTRDQYGNFVANAAGTWSLINMTGGVVSGDLVPASDTKSAVFTGRLTGAAVIHVTSGSLASTDSGTIIVIVGSVSKLSVSGYTTPVTAGTAGNITVTAQDTAGNTVTTYTGTIHFTSIDIQSSLPLDYTFVNADHGTHTFSATLKTAGNQSIAATDTVTGSITGTQTGITVNAAAPSQIRVETAANGSGTVVAAQNVPSGSTVGVFAITRDQYGNFVAQTAATWSLIKTGGVVNDDLYPALDYKSAVFWGSSVGTAVIHVTSGNLISVDSGMLTVIVGPVTKFSVSGYASPAIAGVGSSFTVTAQDFGGNTVAGYSGTVHFTGNDVQAVFPANYTFVSGDHGTHTFNAVLKTSGSQNIVATDTVTGTINGSQVSITINPATPTQVRVEGNGNGIGTTLPAQILGAGLNLTVYSVSRDQYGNFVANVPATWSLISKTGGVADGDLVPASDNKSAVFTGNKIGTAIFHVTSAGLTSVDSGTVTVVVGTLFKLNVSGYGSPATAGVAGDFTVTVQDVMGNTITTYNGTVHFTSTDSHAVLPADYTFVSSDNGIHSFSAAFETVGNQSITAVDGVIGTQSGITVNPAAASQITTETANDGSGNVVSARNITAGSSITVYAVTRDQYGNFVANAPGIWSLTNGTGGVVDGDLVPASDKKSAVFTGHLPGTANIRVTSGSLTSTDSGLLTVTPEINVTGYTSPSMAGVSHSFTVTVQDGSGNNIVNYTGTVHFTSSDNQAVLPLDYTFVAGDNGTHTFNATLETAGSQMITVTDTLTSSITGGQSGITITAAAAAQVKVETQANGSGTVVPVQNITAGSSLTVYAITCDQYGNFVANASATWSLSGKTGGVVNGDLVAAGDNKSAVFTGHLVGTVTITASIATLSGVNSGIVTVIAGPVTRLQINTQPGSTLSVDYALNTAAVVTAYDAQNNPLQGITIVADRDPATGKGTVLGILNVTTNSSGQAIFSNLLYYTAYDAFKVRFSVNNISIISQLVGPLSAGAPTAALVETAVDGTGTELGMITNPHVPIGSSITAYCVERDQYGNFVANAAADS